MTIYLSVALGVAISVLLPVIRAMLPKPPSAQEVGSTWAAIRPYVATGIFSLIVAVLVVAILGDQLNTWRAALLAGYTSDSTLQKFTTGNTAAVS